MSRSVAVIAVTFAFVAPLGHAWQFSPVATVSSSLSVHDGRLCTGLAGDDIACPTYAPNLDTSGNVSTTGYVSATAYYGDGSGLTGISTQSDRITSGTSHVIVSDSAAVTVRTGGSDRLTVTSAGNVGIGTTTPGAPFEVYSAPTASGAARAQGAAYINTSDVFGLTGVASRTGGNPDMIIGVYGSGRSAATDRIIGGYFSIDGTETLTIPNISRPLSAALVANNTNTTENIFVAQDNSSAVFTIKDGGNVGIGTTSPAKTLDVSGTAKISSDTEVVGRVSATEVRVSSSGAACTPALYGTMRYNSVSRFFELCRP